MLKKNTPADDQSIDSTRRVLDSLTADQEVPPPKPPIAPPALNFGPTRKPLPLEQLIKQSPVGKTPAADARFDGPGDRPGLPIS